MAPITADAAASTVCCCCWFTMQQSLNLVFHDCMMLLLLLLHLHSPGSDLQRLTQQSFLALLRLRSVYKPSLIFQYSPKSHHKMCLGIGMISKDEVEESNFLTLNGSLWILL